MCTYDGGFIAGKYCLIGMLDEVVDEFGWVEEGWYSGSGWGKGFGVSNIDGKPINKHGDD